MPRSKDRLATHFVPFSEFEHDAANDAAGLCPDQSAPGRRDGDYHPAQRRSLTVVTTSDLAIDPSSSILAGEDFLDRI